MKSFIISDNIDTLVGLQIAGINGIVLHKREEILKAIDDVMKDTEVGIILITELAGELVQDKINEIKLLKKMPLIIEIPDRHGSRKQDDYILKYIQESIGVKIEVGDGNEHKK